jgi:serine/threonine-protein kinase
MQAGHHLGPFTIEKEIGSGAMGTVYQARYAKGGQRVAIKVIATERGGDSTALARFERETAILKKLKHPNIVRIHGTGRTHGTPFFIMEFIEGGSLEKRLESHQRFTWEEVIQLGQQICSALQHAHEKGVVHRDLKPANIMLTSDGAIKLTDFGIAKGLYMEQITATHCTVGTASYMSPEQCRGDRDLTLKSDLYSLGVMLYELLTGIRPFRATSILDMFKAHLEGSFERPSRLVMDIPIWMDTLVCQLLEKDPDKRPLNAAMVSQGLDRVVEKVTAQRSAAVDAVSKGVLDRPRPDLKPTEEDREAARTLKAAINKKRLKPKTRPVYQRGWFQAAGIASLLLAIIGVVYWATRPPRPDQLFQRAEKLMAAKNVDDADKARDGPIKDYLRYYPDRDDAQAVKMRDWADEIDAARKERQLRNRLRMNLSADGEDEAAARVALRAEESGDLAAAREQWQALAKHKETLDEARRPWGLLAANRLRTLDEVDQLEARLRSRLQANQTGTAKNKAVSDTERLALLATRGEKMEDFTLARDAWRDLHDRYQKETEQRAWFLLAAKKVRELRSRAITDPEAAAKKRRELVKKKLDEAKNLAESQPAEARGICQDILALYENSPDSELAKLTDKARELFKSLSAE